ncbi:hypothetical protein STSP2_01382 [Anaerohalosphaera lusitana]|uniref:Uncharacterized protein n=1 Tax=Anaerohalosphaera lusitana TaxID=1936003 RepID=A0A1U9NL40_9BACT|nr:hypothetical protein [Anaerohalosphaera lusitana]AQT68226.1 hypothetical protein STSP2_01382 [Anaerohalosphaera lusitana]
MEQKQNTLKKWLPSPKLNLIISGTCFMIALISLIVGEYIDAITLPEKYFEPAMYLFIPAVILPLFIRLKCGIKNPFWRSVYYAHLCTVGMAIVSGLLITPVVDSNNILVGIASSFVAFVTPLLFLDPLFEILFWQSQCFFCSYFFLQFACIN